MHIQQSSQPGLAMSIEILWDQPRTVYVEVNSGHGENFNDLLKELTEPNGARVMITQTREPLTDHNGCAAPQREKMPIASDVASLRQPTRACRTW